MAREPFFLNGTLLISWFGFGYIYIYRLGIFRCLVRLKDKKLRFASTVSTHSPNMLWAWLTENGFCFFSGFPWWISISKPIMALNSHNSSDILEHVGACRIASMNLCGVYGGLPTDLPRCGHWFVAQNRRESGFGSSPMLTNAMSSWESNADVLAPSQKKSH